METAIGAFLMCLGLAALSFALRGIQVRSSGPPSAGDRSRSWTSPLSAIQARLALVTVGQRLGYSLDSEAQPGFTVLADSTSPGSYGQLFPVSLISTGGGTLIEIGISAKDPEHPLARVVQERRLEAFARTMRAVFVDAEADIPTLALPADRVGAQDRRKRRRPRARPRST